MVVISYASDLASGLGFVLFISQLAIYLLMRFRMTIGKTIIKLIPNQVLYVCYGMIGILLLNSLYLSYQTNTGYYQALLFFVLVVMLGYNHDYCVIWDELDLTAQKLENLKIHAEVQADEYVKAVNQEIPLDKMMASQAKKASEEIITSTEDNEIPIKDKDL
ncbi:unnamed protein product [Blepharisma stoltei]|uniref:Uncharacterized protein n=1 Tax=Blepharisma stoltei TaxID=1481888 RepID=A0AAU9JGH0_9CILI|nr:unnamed protein product [Blepharisma stoltei]